MTWKQWAAPALHGQLEQIRQAAADRNAKRAESTAATTKEVDAQHEG
jgi:hypothetical protein